MNYKLVGDFETTVLENDCRVWASCLVNIEDNEVINLENNIHSTFEFLKVNSKKHSFEIYYHNLKFDGEFILAYLQEQGFKYDETLSDKMTYKTLITDTGIFYQLELKYWKGKNAKKIVIRDSLKILPLPVETLAKTFGLKTLKGKIAYKEFRKKGHILTQEEIEYIVTDCKIVAECLRAMHELGLTKMTIASNAINSYKNLIGGSQKFRFKFPLLNFAHENGKEEIKTIDEYFRKSYKGGYTYVNPKFQNKDLNQRGSTYDVNSLYPGVMYNEVLPYGMPLHFKGKYPCNEEYPLHISHIKCKFKLKKGFVPTIQLKNNSRFIGRDTEYLSDSGVERVDLYLTSVDLEIFLKHYNVSRLEYIDGYMFKGRKGLFKKYIDYWIEIKIKAEKEGNKGMRQIAKLMLNSLYGKFATNTISDLKIPINVNGVNTLKSKMDIMDSKIEGFYDDITLKEDRERELCYTPMACFITSYARKVTQSAIMENIDGFCYADTDSIHILEKAKNIDIDSTKLGAWKHEGDWSYAKFIRAKTYVEDIIIAEKGELQLVHLDVKCAGMPKSCKKAVTKENFKIGFTTEGMKEEYQKLIPKRVKGGVVLTETYFTIN